MAFPGLAVAHRGFTTRLKWHRLRRSLRDPVFSAEVMAEGLRAGASMELDLRVRADGGFVVLHDALLQGETTGQGAIAAKRREDMQELHFADGKRPLIFSETLAGQLQTAHPDALLQFDMKDDYAAIGPEGVAHLARYFGDSAANIIISGDSLGLIVALSEKLPGIRRGIDPTDRLAEVFRRDGLRVAEGALIRELRGPAEADTVYLAWQLVLEADAQGLDLIGLCHAEGKLVDAWTFNLKDPAAGFSEAEYEAFRRLLDLKADQITTDEAPATEAAWKKRAV